MNVEPNDFESDEELSLPAQHARRSNANPFDVTDEDLAALRAEADTFGEEEAAMSERLLKENLPMATMAIVKIAQSGSTDRVRLDAAKYIVERNLGRLQDINPNARKLPLEDLLNDMYADSKALVVSSIKDANEG